MRDRKSCQDDAREKISEEENKGLGWKDEEMKKEIEFQGLKNHNQDQKIIYFEIFIKNCIILLNFSQKTFRI